MTPERLQKVLARAGVGSRRQVEEMIREGRITIDGRVAQLGDRADLDKESVKVDGRRIAAPRKPQHYVLLNKPSGFVSTVHDPEGRRTVLDLLPQRLRKVLMPVGRLDYATEGLLILTDDGDLAHHVAHPRYGCRKTYEVKVKGRPGEAELDKLRRGIVLDGKRTAPVDIRTRGGHLGARDSVENSWWTVVLGEGRTRQIREMFLRIGHPVARLRRVAIGPLSDPHLQRGAWRDLTEREVEKLRQKTARRRARPRPSDGLSKAAPPKAPPSKAGPPKTRLTKAGSPKAGSSKAGSSKAGSSKAGSSKAGSSKARPRTGPSKPPRPKTARGRGAPSKTAPARPSRKPGKGSGRPRSGSAKTPRRRPRHD